MKASRTVFFGTPAFAVPALAALAELTTVVGVVCQPDRRSGRGMKLRAPAVKEHATALGIPVHQPTRVRDGQLQRWLEDQRAVAAVVAAYGRILPPGVLQAPELGCINLHASILPEYRGAAPIQWALMDGRRETGISLMQMDEGMDTGAVFSVHRLAVSDDADAGELTDSLARLAAQVLKSDLEGVLTGQLKANPQDASRATEAPPIERKHQTVDWAGSAERVANQVRALSPRPGAVSILEGRRLKILRSRPSREMANAAPGTLVGIDDQAIRVACGSGQLRIERAQLEGRPARDARDLINGRAVAVGQRFADPRGGAA